MPARTSLPANKPAAHRESFFKDSRLPFAEGRYSQGRRQCGGHFPECPATCPQPCRWLSPGRCQATDTGETPLDAFDTG